MTALLGKRKRSLAVCLLAAALAAFAFVNTRLAIPALAESDVNPYTVPLVDDINPDPDIVETTIVAQAAGVDIGIGQDVSVLTYNGSIPGPEFRLKVGDTVIVHFRNEIAHPTGIHWHGIELANASDGTPLTQNMVEPGDSFLYKFKVSRPGVYLVPPASSFVDEPGLQGHVRFDHRDRSGSGFAPGWRAAISRRHQDAGAERPDGLQGARLERHSDL